MPEWSVQWNLIPDGVSSIVLIEIKGEFTVSTANALNEAQAVAAQLIARLTDQDYYEVQRGFQAAEDSRMWFGDVPRPDEPPRPGEATDADR